MSFMSQLLLVAALLLLVALWWTGARARETAVLAAKRYCGSHGLQLLDYTVALHRIKVARSRTGNACLQRRFRFEYTYSGAYRDVGFVTMLAQHCVDIEIPYLRDGDGNRVFPSPPQDRDALPGPVPAGDQPADSNPAGNDAAGSANAAATRSGHTLH